MWVQVQGCHVLGRLQGQHKAEHRSGRAMVKSRQLSININPGCWNSFMLLAGHSSHLVMMCQLCCCWCDKVYL
jgi:hypothetical protein